MISEANYTRLGPTRARARGALNRGMDRGRLDQLGQSTLEVIENFMA